MEEAWYLKDGAKYGAISAVRSASLEKETTPTLWLSQVRDLSANHERIEEAISTDLQDS